ncbi:MAG: valine--tRNA ligase [Thermaerobacter sp.]|nr:valine--tRNA ligase [Thermaerobacter sp.]
MLDARYDKAKEEAIYRLWEEAQAFAPSGTGEARTIVMPPPNVTGVLHIGHALDNSMQDALIRFWRLSGRDALWLPGTDHAGIATQVRVEEELAKEGLSRREIGREQFLERVWDWKERSQGTILSQLRALGAGPDWSRQRFTLDEGVSRAVRAAFVRLYQDGLVYRGSYLIHWCPSCRTALSDIEVEYAEREGALYHLHYPLVDGDGGLTVATTRPETMLGDTAVAVHPDDARYQGLVGRLLRHPLTGREIPVVADAAADPEFGTGAVKVTPAHDPTDFDIGVRHALPSIPVIGEDGRMLPAAGERFAGLTREDARKAVAEALEEEGVLLEIEPIRHNVGSCERCGTTVESLVSRQWFVRMKPLAEPAAQAARDGRLEIWPERLGKIYTDWLDNIRDWCVSRQIWWGHRIPAWHCQECGKTVVAMEAPARCPDCGGALHQDEDVLDTWFSSALWPFSTLGWPDDTEDLRRYYPTAALVTGYDILFFWVARMVMMGMYLTNQVPFRNVVLHGLVRDSRGRKMSKSLGNGLDPMEVIAEHGADALRYALLTGTTPGQDIRMSQERVLEGRNFANKIWNAARFVLAQEPDPSASPSDDDVDRWLLQRRDAAAHQMTEALERFELGEAGRIAYEFVWGTYCDWYLELAKPRLADPQQRAGVGRVLLDVLRDALRMVHPFMPFVTEGIWQELPGSAGLLTTDRWVAETAQGDAEALLRVDRFTEAVRLARNLRAEIGIRQGQKAPVIVHAEDPQERDWLLQHEGLFNRLAQAELRLAAQEEAAPRGALSARMPGLELYLPAAGLIDLAAERQRVAKEIADLAAEEGRQEQKLGRPGFRERAPQEIVAQEEERLTGLRDRLARARQREAALSQL